MTLVTFDTDPNREARTPPQVSVIVPARNEEQVVGRCLESLVGQSGVEFEVVLVDDHSTDSTRDIGESFPGVQVAEAAVLPDGWAGKSNACWTGAKRARGKWLLFTDADTVHAPGSLAAAIKEAEGTGSALLSYSPEQEVHGFWERAVMPVIFAELACTFRPKDVCDPLLPDAAANGQYLLITREAYDAVGGHAAVATDILEDVALARLVKQSGRRIHFRIGRGLVRTRMYRGLGQMVEGWTKNLALLFPDAKALAWQRAVEFLTLFVPLGAGILIWRSSPLIAAANALVGGMIILGFYRRIRRAHFDLLSTLISPLGLPVFVYLLRRSRLSHKQGSVRWKGRSYSGAQATVGKQS